MDTCGDNYVLLFRSGPRGAGCTPDAGCVVISVIKNNSTLYDSALFDVHQIWLRDKLEGANQLKTD